ncbi:MAG: Heat-inducible transcription repressor HrcA [Tenericutes bacterium ADurb.Bin239]|nr:MAG: Heat-inducible transcription repressor HrcA [Tenericutes bacterium ADurb.Bin239]
MRYRRRELILKYTVELFIKTAQPVGSKALIENYNLNYSSATIRAEMNALEGMGFLEKPHTSAGRVPSKKGYEFYVANLREDVVSDNFRHHIQTLVEEKTKSVEEVINQTCEILAQMTNLVSVALGPETKGDALQSIHIVELDKNTGTAIFVTNRGYVEHKTFLVPASSSIKEISKVAQIFNERLVGTKISEVAAKMELLRPLLTEYVVEQEVLANAFTEAFIRYARDRLSLYGKESLLEQPEFINDSEKLRKLIAILDDPLKLRELISGNGDVSINIGESYEDLTLISANVHIPGDQVGQIVLVGPKRMDYSSVLWALEYVTDELEKYFEIEREINNE